MNLVILVESSAFKFQVFVQNFGDILNLNFKELELFNSFTTNKNILN